MIGTATFTSRYSGSFPTGKRGRILASEPISKEIDDGDANEEGYLNEQQLPEEQSAIYLLLKVCFRKVKILFFPQELLKSHKSFQLLNYKTIPRLFIAIKWNLRRLALTHTVTHPRASD